jgi:VCBS repeat-containing protein
VLSNDTDADLDPLQAVLVSGTSSGTLNLNVDGSFDYTPQADFSGMDSFTYLASDTLLDSNVATVSIAVVAPPTATNDGYGLDEDATLVVPSVSGVLANDADNNPPSDLTAVLLASPSNGTLTSFSSDGGFTYVPNADFNGVDSFTYEAADGGTGASAQATVTLTVNSLNDEPVAVDDGYQAELNTALVVNATAGVLSNDTDAELDPLQAVLVADVSSGVLSLNADGSFSYTPALDFSGVDSFTYVANDTAVDSNVATVTLTVNGTNDPPQILTGTIAFTKQLIDVTVDQAHSVVAADLTGDGHIDAAATDFVDDTVFWYENDGNGVLQQRVLDAGLDGAYPLHAADVNLDGDMDLLAGGYLGDTFVWYENDGTGGFTRRVIDSAADGAHSIVTGDMDGDGDIDLLATNQDANTITWYENDGTSNFGLPIVIDSAATGAKRAEFADVDGDGDQDVISASFFNDEVAWHENDGSQGFAKQVIDNTADGAYYVFPADLNGDGNVDVLAASQLDATIAWYRNDGPSGFTAQPIDTGANGARMVIAADLDQDGDLDALATSVDDDTVAWYRNDGNGNFVKQGIDAAADGAYGVFSVDIDRDGDIDVLSASRDANAIAMHLQIKTHSDLVEQAGTLVFDSAVLRTIDPDDGPSELTYTITDATGFGELRLDGVPLTSGGTFTQDDIDSGRLAYVHDGGDSPADSFSFTVADGGEGGFSPLAGTFAITITGAGGDTIVELRLDEGSGTVAVDSSGLGNDGMLVNGPVYEADTPDGSPYAVRFDGQDDYIDLGVLDVDGNGLTLAASFKADSFPGPSKDPRLISKASGTAANDHVFMLGTVAAGSEIRLRARLRVGGTTTTLIAPSGDLQTGQWHHAAVTYDGTTLRLYLDGADVGNIPLSGSVDIDPSVAVAVGNQPAGAGARSFNRRWRWMTATRRTRTPRWSWTWQAAC